VKEHVEIGRYLAAPGEGRGLQVLCDAPELEPHVGRAWFRAYAAQRLDLPPEREAGASPRPGRAEVGADLLSRHAVVCGSTGSGKTRLALHLLAEQVRAGCSVVMLDPKAETIRHLLHLAHAAGVPPEEVTLLSPHGEGAGAPGWNPLDGRATGLSPAQAAADFVSVLAKSSDSWGPRLQDVLTNALIVVCAHGLSLFELARLLQRDDYRAGLLGRQPDRETMGDAVVYEEARTYFLREFAAWGKSERASAVAPVLNKFRELLRSPFLRSLLCARRSTLDLPSLWKRRGLVLVHLDGAGLGDEGARLLGGLLAHQLLRTAMRTDGPVPVVLALDEMGVSEQFLGSALCQILAIARSRNLRLLVACQHLAQLSDGLRTALLANTAIQSFFRLGHADARAVASALTAGTGERVSSIAADVAKRDVEGLPETWAESAHTVRDGHGDPIKLSAPAWTAFLDVVGRGDGTDQIVALKRLAVVSGVERLYVQAADTKQPMELERYVARIAPDEFRLKGPAPVRLVVSFPRPRLSVLSRESEGERQQAWAKRLMELPNRQAAVRLAGGTPGVVQVVEVSDPIRVTGQEKFLSAAVAGSGQSPRELEETLDWRRDCVERIATGKGFADEGGDQGDQSPEPFGPGASGLTGAEARLPPAPPHGSNNRGRRAAVAPPAARASSDLVKDLISVGVVGEDGSIA
jgi:hypothetical protein